MTFSRSNQRYYAAFLLLGAGVLLYRTIAMIRNGALSILVTWVSLTLIIEMLLDGVCFLLILPWLRTGDSRKAPLGCAAACTVVHALRVLIFVVGRFDNTPWKDFDVRPEHRYNHDTRWKWAHVYLAGTLSTLSLLMAGLIWGFRWLQVRPKERTY